MEYIFPDFKYIAINPEVCTGKPHINGTRITVTAILAYLAGGMSIETMLDEFLCNIRRKMFTQVVEEIHICFFRNDFIDGFADEIQTVVFRKTIFSNQDFFRIRIYSGKITFPENK